MQAKSVGEKGKMVSDEYWNEICKTKIQRRTATFKNIEDATQGKQSEHEIHSKIDIKTTCDQTS